MRARRREDLAPGASLEIHLEGARPESVNEPPDTGLMLSVSMRWSQRKPRGARASPAPAPRSAVLFRKQQLRLCAGFTPPASMPQLATGLNSSKTPINELSKKRNEGIPKISGNPASPLKTRVRIKAAMASRPNALSATKPVAMRLRRLGAIFSKRTRNISTSDIG